MIQPLRIFIGVDSRERVAFSVLASSIMRRATIPVAIIPLTLDSLQRGGIYTRERTSLESTEFSFSRFLVPYLSGYDGHSVFMDCDMLCLADVLELWLPVLAYPGKAVYVCKHDYTPKDATKFLGQKQTAYPRKNWSSLMVFDNAKCKALTPAYVNNASGLHLHRFLWTDDELIGDLPLEWNWLIGEYQKNPNAKNLHYTLGGPWFQESGTCDHADDWWSEYRAMLEPALVKEMA